MKYYSNSASHQAHIMYNYSTKRVFFIDYALFNFLREIKSCLHRPDDLLCHLTNFSLHKMMNFFSK